MSGLKVDLTLMELGERDRERFERLDRLVEGALGRRQPEGVHNRNLDARG